MDISIIIPVYNAAETLEKCITSVDMQIGIDDLQVEVILVDDGSDDGSGKLCDRIKEKYSKLNIKVLHKENGGVSKARNEALAVAQGRYISFIDADDTVKRDALHYMYHAINDTDLKMVSMTGRSDKSDEIVSGYNYVSEYLLYKDTHVWGKMYRSDFVKDILFDSELSIGEDMLFLLDIAARVGKAKEILCLKEQKYEYYDNAQGAMKSRFKLSYLDEIKCWEMAEKRLKELQISNEDFDFKKAFSRIAVIKVYSSMLVIGKLANIKPSLDDELGGKSLKEILVICSESLNRALKVKGTFSRLENGYKVKVLIYKLNPNIYLKLYGSWKNGR